ncbi:MAG: hypothetical protein ACM3O4_05335 [Ignavibacteriales bacterium]
MSKKNSIVYIVFILLMLISSQIIILSDLEHLGDTSTGGGFIPYGFGIKLNIFITATLLLIAFVIFKKLSKSEFKIWKILLSILLTAIITYNINLFIFNNVIDINDWDGDGLSNTYEERVGTNKFIKNNEDLTFEADKIEFNNTNLVVKDIVVKVIGKEDYSNVMIRDTSTLYYGEMSNILQIDIGNFGTETEFKYIQVEIYLNESQDTNDYYPATYKKVTIEHPGIENYYYDDGEIEPLNYTVDEKANSYIVKIPYEFYTRSDLFTNGNSIYVGLCLKY